MYTPERRPTILDVAKLAGVDRALVSRVMNADPKLSIRQETRERILAAVAELRYEPNANARSLRTSRSGIIGLVIPDFENPVYAAIIKGAEAAATESGQFLLTGSAGDGAQEPGRFLDLLHQQRVDGLLIAGPSIPEKALRAMSSAGRPWLYLNRRVGAVWRYAILDDEKAARMAVDHLVELGHQRIACVAGPPTADTARRRKTGYTRALQRHQLATGPELIASGPYTVAGGVEAVEELLSLGARFTALVVANVAMAVGALAALRRAGHRVPEDVSVVAIHDLPLAASLTPALTSVRMPLIELGRRGVEILRALHSADEPVTEVVREPMELIVRDSTAPPPTAARRRASG